jgi:hypothetical protein
VLYFRYKVKLYKSPLSVFGSKYFFTNKHTFSSILYFLIFYSQLVDCIFFSSPGRKFSYLICSYIWRLAIETHLRISVMLDSLSFTYISFSHFWDRPVPIFSNVRFSYLALVQDKKIMCVLLANACCTVYVNCLPNSPSFSFLK